MAKHDSSVQISAAIVRDYSEGRLNWSQLREGTGVEDFGIVLRRLGEEGLKLPRASRARETRAREWLREALAKAADRA